MDFFLKIRIEEIFIEVTGDCEPAYMEISFTKPSHISNFLGTHYKNLIKKRISLLQV
jgi:hypothetical protein